MGSGRSTHRQASEVATRRPATDAITDVPGVTVGHWTDRRRATGCTVVLVEGGATPGYCNGGGAPGTIETDLLRPENMVQRIHAVLLTGGSAPGLARGGRRARLAARARGGFSARPQAAPQCPWSAAPWCSTTALARRAPTQPQGQDIERRQRRGVGRWRRAAWVWGPAAPWAKGRRGEHALKGGVGTASVTHESGLVVGALVAVNAFGDVVDPTSGALVAGPRGSRRGSMERAAELLRKKPLATYLSEAEAMRAALQDTPSEPAPPVATTLAIVATNARLDKAPGCAAGDHGQRRLGAQHRSGACARATAMWSFLWLRAS